MLKGGEGTGWEMSLLLPAKSAQSMDSMVQTPKAMWYSSSVFCQDKGSISFSGIVVYTVSKSLSIACTHEVNKIIIIKPHLTDVESKTNQT